MTTKRSPQVCPRCGVTYTDYPALSRLDNKTDICTKCGTDEAMFNWQHPGQALPPITEKVWG